MEKFFVIGSEDPGFMNTEKITLLPEFQGVVLPEGNSIRNKYIPAPNWVTAETLRTVSIGSFLLYAKKNPGVTLVSCYDFPAGRLYVKKLQEAAQNKFKVCDYYNFCYEYNISLMFTPAQEERRIILGAKKQWAELRQQLTDEFSRFSLDCYLAAYEKMDTSLLLPAYVGLNNIYFNRVSRKLSLVPGPSDIYVDVGALDGDTVTGFVNSTESYKAIYAYEPIKSAYDALEKRKFYLNNFYPKNVAVSNKKGSLDFFAGITSSGSRVVDKTSSQKADFYNIPCTTLDDELDEATLLKIEVEGHEKAVIEGAAHLIRKCRPDIVVQVYHYPLDPIHILEAVNKIHKYKHIALRYYTVGMHIFSLLFSDRAPFE